MCIWSQEVKSLQKVRNLVCKDKMQINQNNILYHDFAEARKRDVQERLKLVAVGGGYFCIFLFLLVG